MTTLYDDNVTELMIKLCYNCDDVYKCDTEGKVIKCFEDRMLIEAQGEDVNLREAFILYAY